MATYHLAQLNIGRPVGPRDDPRMADFYAALVEINDLAVRAPGFVWRLTDDDGADATSLRLSDGDAMVNMSVWESVEALRDYVYHSAHLDLLRRRREWFHREGLPEHQVLWWVPAGHVPTLAEAEQRLARLEAEGAGPAAFTLRQPYPPPIGEGVAIAPTAR